MTVQKQIPEDYMPILSMMVKPRDAFRYALQEKTFSYALYTGAVGGFASSLVTLYGSKYPTGFSLGQIVYSSFVIGILVFMMTNLIMALFLKVVGSAFGGKGEYKTLFQTMCLTMIPSIWVLPIVLFWMQLAPQTFFSLHETISLGEAIGSYIGAFFILVASVWALVLGVIGISEAHSFSKWKAFFTFFISSLATGLMMGVIGILLV